MPSLLFLPVSVQAAYPVSAAVPARVRDLGHRASAVLVQEVLRPALVAAAARLAMPTTCLQGLSADGARARTTAATT